VTSLDIGWQRLAAEIEPEDAISECPTEQQLTESTEQVSALCLYGNGNACHCVASPDPILIRLIELWPSLSADTRKTIRAICVDAVLLGDQ
jgi:hypothetical protein